MRARRGDQRRGAVRGRVERPIVDILRIDQRMSFYLPLDNLVHRIAVENEPLAVVDDVAGDLTLSGAEPREIERLRAAEIEADTQDQCEGDESDEDDRSARHVRAAGPAPARACRVDAAQVERQRRPAARSPRGRRPGAR